MLAPPVSAPRTRLNACSLAPLPLGRLGSPPINAAALLVITKRHRGVETVKRPIHQMRDTCIDIIGFIQDYRRSRFPLGPRLWNSSNTPRRDFNDCPASISLAVIRTLGRGIFCLADLRTVRWKVAVGVAAFRQGRSGIPGISLATESSQV